MIPFDFHPRTRIVFGPGKVDALGELAGELGARRVLVVSDPGIVATGHTERGMAALRRAGIETHLFEGVEENPTTDNVEAGLTLARRYDPELLVGLGGGSSMDCTKGINFLLTNGGRMQDYWGVGKATRPMLPMIAVPTTAGTGSETQSFALISDAKTHVKMACGDKKASFRVALLDPMLTVTQPRRVTALTGIDAIAHALETYVTKSRNPASLAFSREAWLLLGENFARVLDDSTDLEARGGMQLGALLCRAGDREFDARRGPRPGQSADDELSNSAWTRGGLDAPACHPVQWSRGQWLVLRSAGMHGRGERFSPRGSWRCRARGLRGPFDPSCGIAGTLVGMRRRAESVAATGRGGCEAVDRRLQPA